VHNTISHTLLKNATFLIILLAQIVTPNSSYHEDYFLSLLNTVHVNSALYFHVKSCWV